ncbi:helix-turn-helix transcriptional regulator [Pseudomonas lurida]|uniref:helix-turn-helix domain-containing protein n=1 Tax=Pseudomonas lurida TaxID=244566 RepID=UPI001648116D|nr:helix-turn-helix transcriptional regulator [Pseudomonas lurida]MBC3239462.1 helix-turn-helix transcriptional regulator [Pseudomonas lurida]
MNMKQAFGRALKTRRQQHGLTQEDFSDVSSRTYLSTLERGMKCPTLEKVVELASVLEVHPITLIAESFLMLDSCQSLENLLAQVRSEVQVGGGEQVEKRQQET